MCIYIYFWSVKKHGQVSLIASPYLYSETHTYTQRKILREREVSRGLGTAEGQEPRIGWGLRRTEGEGRSGWGRIGVGGRRPWSCFVTWPSFHVVVPSLSPSSPLPSPSPSTLLFFSHILPRSRLTVSLPCLAFYLPPPPRHHAAPQFYILLYNRALRSNNKK